jgi:hypothetical protein
LVVCLLATVAVPALGDSCNMWQHSSLNYQPTDADTFSATHYYAIHCAAAAIRTVAWGKMQRCPISAIHSRFTLHFSANGNVFRQKLQSSQHSSQFRVKTNWKSSWGCVKCCLRWRLEFFWPFQNAMLCLLAALKYEVIQITLGHVSLVLCLWSASAYWMLPPKVMSIKTEHIHPAGAQLCQLHYLTVSIRPDQNLSPLSFPWFWIA